MTDATSPRPAAPTPAASLPTLSEYDALDRIAVVLSSPSAAYSEHLAEIAAIIRETGRSPAVVAARLTAPTRADRYAEVIERWDARINVPDMPETATASYRFALVEEGRSDGSHWLSLHDTPELAASYHHEQEDAADWMILELVDLDTGVALGVLEEKIAVTWGPVQ